MKLIPDSRLQVGTAGVWLSSVGFRLEANDSDGALKLLGRLGWFTRGSRLRLGVSGCSFKVGNLKTEQGRDVSGFG